MNSLHAIYVDQMVRAIRQEQERESARRELIASLPSESFVAKSRRIVGASVIGAGKVIQGEAEGRIEFGSGYEAPLKPAR
jgi:hypothetical protein